MDLVHNGIVKYSLIVFCFSPALAVHSAEGTVLLREDFNDLIDWKPLYFPKHDEGRKENR
jgi:hypothetical protein